MKYVNLEKRGERWGGGERESWEGKGRERGVREREREIYRIDS